MQIDVLKSMIGHGSSATVWIARTEKLTDFVAIKIYHSYEFEVPGGAADGYVFSWEGVAT